MKKRAVIIAGVFVLLVAGLIWYFVGTEKPEAVLQKYMKYAQQGSYEKMYEMLDQNSRKTVSAEEFITRNKNIYEGMEAQNLEITVKSADDQMNGVTYLTTVNTAAGPAKFRNQMFFTKEGRYWKIQWQDGLIYPGLEADYKIRVKSLEPERGNICDRNGKTLAGRGSAFSVGLVPGKMNKNKDLQEIAVGLDLTLKAVKKKLSASWVTNGTFVPLKNVKNLDSVDTDLLAIDGVAVNKIESRIYPLGKKAAHLVGYVQDISREELEELASQGYTAQSVIGKSGLEKAYEKELHGKAGCKIYMTNRKGVEKKVIAVTKAVNGKDIKTTIDRRVQGELYDTFKQDKSSSVAMNPGTGEILALVSTPSFDSSDFVLGMSQKQWDKLNNDKDGPMYNRIQATWCPGSSLKPITGAIGISSGKLDPEKNFGHSGLSWQKDPSWGNYNVTTLHEYDGPANLKNALIHSDNIYFAKAALQIGANTLADQFNKIGFNRQLPFDLYIKKSQFGEKKALEQQIQLADTGYGQGQVLVNPVHMASMYSAFVNGGDMLKPYLQYKKGEKPSFWIENAFTKAAADTMKTDMVQVVNNPNGTAHGIYTPEQVLAAKTGTAEIKASQDDDSGTELGWLVTIYEDQKSPLLLVTMVEDVKHRGGSAYVVEKTKGMLKHLI